MQSQVGRGVLKQVKISKYISKFRITKDNAISTTYNSLNIDVSNHKAGFYKEEAGSKTTKDGKTREEDDNKTEEESLRIMKHDGIKKRIVKKIGMNRTLAKKKEKELEQKAHDDHKFHQNLSKVNISSDKIRNLIESDISFKDLGKTLNRGIKTKTTKLEGKTDKGSNLNFTSITKKIGGKSRLISSFMMTPNLRELNSSKRNLTTDSPEEEKESVALQ